MEIIGLGYVGLDVPDTAAWLAFGRDILGLDPGRAPDRDAYLPAAETEGRGADESVYFRVDDWSWRLALHPAAEPGLRYMGLEVAGPQELDAALAELEAAGFPARRGDTAECTARAVSGIGFTWLSPSDGVKSAYRRYRPARGKVQVSRKMPSSPRTGCWCSNQAMSSEVITK